MHHLKQNWKRLQSGQAMMEYWPTLGASVAFLSLSVWLSLGIWNFYRTAVDSFNRVGSSSEVCTMTQSDAEGGSADSGDLQPTGPVEGDGVGDVEGLGTHRVELVANSYNPETDRTTLAYRITSGRKPSISHVVFGFASCASVAQVNETYEWVNPDPTTGAVGLKFDDTYNDYETRTVVVTLRGRYQMGNVAVTTKAGRDQVYTGMITGPVSCEQEALDNTQEDQLYSGCVPD